MDISKKAAFVKKMGKKKLKLIKRQHFDGGGIAGLLGAAGGEGGTGFQTPSGTNAQQIDDTYTQGKSALVNNANLVSNLNPQVPGAVKAQNVLSTQYANQAAGLGPNVAQNQLNQATGANVANEAAIMAGQRGAGANPALLARQAAMTGAGIQQQSAGQAATLGAQQQIAAEQAQAQLAGNQIAQAQGATDAFTSANQNEQGILQGANTANNNIQGQLANTTMQGQQKVLGGIGNAIGGITGLFAEGGEVEPHGLDFVHKMTKMGLDHHSKVMMADGGVTPSPTPQQKSGFSFGAPQAAAADKPPVQQVQDSMRKAFHFSDGGDVSGAQSAQDSMRKAFHFDEGGDVQPEDMNPNMQMADESGGMHPHFQGPHKSHVANYLFNKGGPVPAMVSPGEIYLSPKHVQMVLNEDVDPAEVGHKFKGKAKVKGDSLKNDNIPATLEEGGVVIDREHMGSADKRKLFVHRAIAKKKAGSR